MSRSNPTQRHLALSAAPQPTPKIPVVNLAQQPPEGMRWLNIGEKMEAGDMAVSQLPWTPIPDILMGQRLHKEDLGCFARWIEAPKPLGLMARILQKQK